MKKILFIVNSLREFDFGETLAELLPGVQTTVSESLPGHFEEYGLVVLWSIRKLLPAVAGACNVVVFHSSDLPQGKGWAPIYNALAGDLEFFTVTGIRPALEADVGDIVVKARFRIRPEYTAEHLRRWDHRISIMLAAKLLERFPDGNLRGSRQTGAGTWNPRRRPEENEVSPDRPLAELVNHLRACEPRHPAFFNFRGVRYDIHITPHHPPAFPDDLEILFHDTP